MTLLSEPRLLLLDEPCAGLSRQETRRQIGIIAAGVQTLGATALIVEHDMAAVEALASRVHVFAPGTPARERHARRDPGRRGSATRSCRRTEMTHVARVRWARRRLRRHRRAARRPAARCARAKQMGVLRAQRRRQDDSAAAADGLPAARAQVASAGKADRWRRCRYIRDAAPASATRRRKAWCSTSFRYRTTSPCIAPTGAWTRTRNCSPLFRRGSPTACARPAGELSAAARRNWSHFCRVLAEASPLTLLDQPFREACSQENLDHMIRLLPGRRAARRRVHHRRAEPRLPARDDAAGPRARSR